MESKKSKAFEIFKRNFELEDRDILTLFKSELGLKENTAKTYLSLCKRTFSDKLQLNYTKRKIDARKTKKGKALEIFRSNTHLDRKGIIKLFVQKLGMSENSASVHCSMCVKEYSGPKHRAIK